jgi:hypothetical protein
MRAYCVLCGLLAFGLGCLQSGGANAGESPSALPYFSKLQLPAGRAELSNGFDKTANGWGSYSTAVVALEGPLHVDGWRLKLSGGYGSYNYLTRDVTTCIDIHNGDKPPNRTLAKICDDIRGPSAVEPTAGTLAYLADYGLEIEGNRLIAAKQHEATRYDAAIAPGYQFTLGTVILKAYLGLGYELHEVTPLDSGKALGGSYWGAQGGLEAWVTLGEDFWISADASYFTGTDAHAAAMKLGYKAWPWLSLGPEFAAYGNADDTSGRAGAFLRLDALGVETTLAGGLSGTYKDDPGAYGSASIYMKF